jgi:hypothetical protein
MTDQLYILQSSVQFRPKLALDEIIRDVIADRRAAVGTKQPQP